MTKKVPSARWSLGIVVLATVSCGSPGDGATGGGATCDGGSPGLCLELLAGDTGGRGNTDGTGAAARFNFVSGVALDGARNVYVADTSNQTIRKITAAGVVTTLAGTAGMVGNVDGKGAAARFNFPNGVAVDSAGNVYVADQDNQTIRKVTGDGVVTTLAGTAGMAGSADGTGAAARFNFPLSVAVDSAGNVYVADENNAAIRKVTAAGVVTTLAKTADPAGVAVDSAGNVYVAGRSDQTIRKITAAGVVTTLAGTAGMRGSTDGTGADARFEYPTGVAVDSVGNVYVADQLGETVRKVTAAGVVTTLAGSVTMAGSADGTGADARFEYPAGVAVDSAGNVYVADQSNDTIRKVTAAGVVTTLAGTAGMAGSADGTGAAARFADPSGVAADSAGNVYVADQSNDTVRKITAAGVVTTLAGTAGVFSSADGTGAAAGFNFPADVATDSAGNVYVADHDNITIRKVTATGVVTTLAGASGTTGSRDGTGPAARFSLPTGVAVDSAGNVYVADQDNQTIRKVTGDGVVTTLAGTAGMAGSADGTGAAARFNDPAGVAVDRAGNVYVADQNNHTIRKITATGVVTTLAGSAGMVGSADGTGAAARFFSPTGVAVDSAGNVYVADELNSAIRKVAPDGTTTTVAGVAGMGGIRLGTTPRLAFPRRLSTVGDSLVISDTNAILLLHHGAQSMP